MGEHIGHGVKQRDKVRMAPGEVAAFLAGRHSMTMSTLNADGTIHSVGMWYGFLEGEIALESKAKAQKVRNLRRNPAITLLVEAGDYYEELRGVSITGTAEIVEDPSRIWELGVSVFTRYTAPYTEAMRPAVETMLHKRVAIKVTPTKTTSWDHRKLALPSTRPRQS